MSCGRNLTSLSIQQKLEILDCIQQHKKSRKQLAVQYKCDLSTIRRIVKQEDRLRRIAFENGDTSRKRLRRSKFEQIDEAVANWFYQMRLKKKKSISGTMLMAEAKKIAAKMNVSEFKPSNGWLSRWKVKHNVLFRKMQEATGTPDQLTLTDGKWFETEFPNLVQGYHEEDVFIADETGLFYKSLPGRMTVCNSQDESSRITLLLLCNMEGSEKEVIAIGKQKHTHSFWGREPPIQYFSHHKSWMTTEIWRQILVTFNNRMRKENRKVTLFVNDAACHKLDTLVIFNHINVQYFPANTLVIKPLHQGFVRSFKSHYRNTILRKHLLFLESGRTSQEFADSLTILDALRIAKHSWELVPPFIIKKCFNKAGFVGQKTGADKDEKDEVLDVPIPRSEFDNFVNCDANLVCYGENSNDQIVQKQPGCTEEGNEVKESKEALKFFCEIPSREEALSALSTLRSYLDYKGEDLSHIEAVEDQLFKLSERKLLKTEINACNLKLETMF